MALVIGGNVQITGNITVTNESGVPSTVEYLVVAGGGKGGLAGWGGGGGAKGTYVAGTSTGGSGGSGIVIIRYSDSFAAASTTGSPTVTVSGGYRIYQFTGSGSITF